MSSWTSKGKSFRPMGAFYSSNPEKAERTIKRLTPSQKRYLARGAAMRYRNE